MLTLYVLRHGEAAPASGVDDRDRVLTEGGLRAMQDLSPLLSGMPDQPGIALCSPAQRTRQTQRAVAPSLPVRIIEDMYDAPVERLLAIVQGLDDSHRAALLVGHNPAIQQLVLMLARNGTEALRGLVAMDYKAGTMAVIQSRMMRWETFGPDNAELVNLLVPPFAAGAAA
ncbi:MAG: histidine phosphatase family protein [Alphaproteobacteria bacterium]|nr:histidine phosphatase family protein [Alphaproteobacteria bacterium]